jgi:hypothetical protein
MTSPRTLLAATDVVSRRRHTGAQPVGAAGAPSRTLRARDRRRDEGSRPQPVPSGGLTAEELRAAADSFMAVDGASAADYGTVLARVPEETLLAGWAGSSGRARALGDLLLLVREIREADGAYEDLLRRATAAEPTEAAAGYEARLMLCGGRLGPVAADLADVFTQVRKVYVEQVGRHDDVAAELDQRAAALRRGPLDDGGFLPAGYWG